MPTYRQDFHIRGHERVDVALVVSDSYAGLADVSPTPVNGIFGIGTSRKDLDVDVGVAGVDQLEFTLDPRAVVTQNDLDCHDWILEAQGSDRDTSKKRYVGLLVNQTGPTPQPGDWEFRGLITPEMSAAGSDWQGSEYDINPDPTLVWKLSALSLEIADFLEAKVEDLVKNIVATDQDFIDTNCPDRLGWFRKIADSDSYGHREGRYGSMGRLIDILNRLLDEAVYGKPVEIQLLDSDLGLTAWAANFKTLTTERPSGILGLGSKTVDFRYGPPSKFYPKLDGQSIWKVPQGDDGQWPYRTRSLPTKDPLMLSDIYVTWRLLTPREESRHISWLPNDTIGGLIYAIAFALGCWVRWEFVSNTHINCRILSRKEADIADTVYLADAESDDIDVAPNEAQTGRLLFPAALYAEEGMLSSYRYDGSWGPARLWSGQTTKGREGEPDGSGPMIALSLAPTVCVLWDKAYDAGVEFSAEDEYHLAPMPHNGIFYNDTNNRENPGFPGADLTDVHTAMYVGFTAPGDDPCIGCAGRFVVRPIAAIGFEYYEPVLGTTIPTVSYAIETYLNLLRHIDRSAYQVERRIVVPYITRFRDDPAGTDDWRYCVPGNKIVFDGVTYVIAGIERDFEKGQTTLRLHSTTRVSFSENGTEPDPTDPTSGILALEGASTPTFGRATYPSGGPITKFAAVIADPDGRLHEAPADGWSYGRVLGIALTAAAGEGERVEIATGGIVQLDSDHFSAGDRIYLRSPSSPAALVANLSNVPVRTVSASENLHQVLATAMSTRTLKIEIDRPVFLAESVEVPDFTTFSEVFT